MPTAAQTAILANLDKAIGIIEQIPDEALDLSKFKHKCGTIACTAGWLASDPYFQALGMALTPNPDSPQPFLLTQNGDLAFCYEWLDDLFGEEAFDRLFAERGAAHDDAFLMDQHGDDFMTDKQLALARLKERRDDLAYDFSY